MSYEVYKVIHLVSLIVVTACLGIGYFCKPSLKWARILGMTSSLLLMVAGMGLLARAYPGQPWPMWVKLKLLIWVFIAVAGPLLAKRLTKNRGITFAFFMALFSIAIGLVIFKPFL